MTSNCISCGLQDWLCLCTEVPAIQLQTSLNFIVHYREAHKISNTARLFKMSDPSVGWFVYGLKDQLLDLDGLLQSNKKPIVLFPRQDAEDLSTYLQTHSSKDVQLIIPDGNWGQAARIANRLSKHPDIQFVSLPKDNISSYQLRYNPNPGRICTFEAALYALNLIEPETCLKPLHASFEKLVQRLLWQRGKIPREEKEQRIMLLKS